MELLQAEIEAGTSNIKLARKPRWLQPPGAMETILSEPKKRIASVKITIINVEDQNSITKQGI